MYIIHFPTSFVHGHVDCFHIVAIVKCSAINIVLIILRPWFKFLWLNTQRWDCWIIEWFCFYFTELHAILFYGTPHHFPQWINIYCVPNGGNVLIPPHGHAHTHEQRYIYIFANNHLDKCDVIAHGFGLFSLMINDVEHFNMPAGYFYIFLFIHLF